MKAQRMNVDISTLSDLATVALEVESALAKGRIDRAIFEKLQDQINHLQQNCPNHLGVLRARVQWFELALDSFERHVVEIGEKGRWPYCLYNLHFPHDNEPKELLTGTGTINHFLTRAYLRGEFGRLYTRVIALYRRIMVANVGDFVRSAFFKLVEDLEKKLLNGEF